MENKLNSTGRIIERIKQIYGFITDVELGKFLGRTPTVISMWRVRDSLDYQLILEKCGEYDLNWIFTGSTDVNQFSINNDDIPQDKKAIHGWLINEYGSLGNYATRNNVNLVELISSFTNEARPLPAILYIEYNRKNTAIVSEKIYNYSLPDASFNLELTTELYNIVRKAIKDDRKEHEENQKRDIV